jgi:hypothetical protein
VTECNAFAGSARRVSVYGVAAAAIKIQRGLAAVDHRDNTYRFERTRREVAPGLLSFACPAGNPTH